MPMSLRARQTLLLILSGLFLILDQSLKWLATHTWTTSRLLTPYFGWNPFLNPGIAFGIPLPPTLVLFGTLPIILGLGFLVVKKLVSHDDRLAALAAPLLLVTGAFSNLIDRLLFGHTIDYVRVIISIFNIADVLIVIGFVVYFVAPTAKKE